jgi:hypothetical protein
MQAKITFLFMLLFVFTSFVSARQNIRQILMSQQWYEEPIPVTGPRIGYDKDARIGYDFGKRSVRMYLFGQKDPDGKELSGTYPYYLCDSLPDYGAYDKGKVGKKSSGKYLIILEKRTDGSIHPLRYELVSVDNQCIKIAVHDVKIIIERTLRPK